MSIETQLREALTARAAEVGGSDGDPYARVSGAVRSSQRRRRAIAGGVAAVAIAAGVLAPQVIGNQTHRGATPATHTLQLPAPTDPAWQQFTTWPTRGSLAGDKAFMAAATARFDGDAPRILFAGDIEDTRLVVAFQRVPVPEDEQMAGETTTEQLRVLSGPRQASVGSLQLGADQQPVEHSALVVRQNVGPDGWLLVLAPRGVEKAELSTSVTIAPPGTVSRTWSTLPLTDGVGVTQVRNAPQPVTRVRVGAYDGNFQLAASNDDPTPPSSAAFCGGCGDAFYDSGIDATRAGFAWILGLRPDQITIKDTIRGRIDPALQTKDGMYGTKGAIARVLVADGRLPSGAVVRAVAVSVTENDGGGSVTQPEEIVPIDAATANRRPWTAWTTDPGGNGMILQVFAPGAASVRIISDSPSIYPGSARTTVRNGSAVVGVDVGETAMAQLKVVTYDAKGAELGRWPVRSTNSDDPLDLAPGN